MAERVDGRGLSCPEPVILTRNALQRAGAGEITVLLDTMAQVHNCTRIARKLGWQATWIEKDNVFELTLTAS